MPDSKSSFSIGIDLAAQPKATAACVLEWSSPLARVRLLRGGLDDSGIADLVRRYAPAKVGIDAPFGWPRPFVRAVAAHDRGDRWSLPLFDDLVLRTTDIHVRSVRRPLSVSSDKIAVTAMRCARLLGLLADGGPELDRSGGQMVVEVYPAAALVRWGFDANGYKGTKPECRDTRRQLVTRFAQVCKPWLQLDSEEVVALASSDHMFDALISALVARACEVGATDPIPVDVRKIAAIEGWIHLPSLGSLSSEHLFSDRSA